MNILEPCLIPSKINKNLLLSLLFLFYNSEEKVRLNQIKYAEDHVSKSMST
jgi:hypothetical protein